MRRRSHPLPLSAASAWDISAGHPVAHIWYTRRIPSYLGMLLDISRRNLDRVLYFAQYIVTYVDEEARKKALKRLEDEISVSEREQAAASTPRSPRSRPSAITS